MSLQYRITCHIHKITVYKYINIYYFSAHDYDKNTMLDGLELMSAFAHNMENYDDTDSKMVNLENYTGKLLFSYKHNILTNRFFRLG